AGRREAQRPRQRGARDRPFPLKPGRVFKHRLALALHRTVGELERTMSWRELRDWWRFEAVNGYHLPDLLSDLQNGLLGSVIVNTQRTEDSDAALPSSFYCIRDFRPPEPEPDVELTESDKARIAWRGA